MVEGCDYFKCPSVVTAVLLYFHQTNRKHKSIRFVKMPTNSTVAKHKLEGMNAAQQGQGGRESGQSGQSGQQ